jgi:hypothetical protein
MLTCPFRGGAVVNIKHFMRNDLLSKIDGKIIRILGNHFGESF